VICFPFAQHYIADSPGCYTPVKDIDDLISKYNKLADTENVKTFSARTIVNQIIIGIAVTAVAITLLFLIL